MRKWLAEKAFLAVMAIPPLRRAIIRLFAKRLVAKMCEDLARRDGEKGGAS